MKHYKIIITASAEQDLLSSYYYIYFELKNPIAAEKFKITLRDRIDLLAKAPFAGERHKHFTEYRIAHALRYRIFYTVDDDSRAVVISRVFYAGKDEPSSDELPK